MDSNLSSGLGYVLLSRIVGDDVMAYIGASGTGSAATAMVTAMNYSATAAVMLTGLILTYIPLVALVRASKEGGSMLGQGWSGNFVFARLLFGITAVPMANSVSLMQLLVIALALAGNAIGNIGASSMAVGLYNGSSFKVSTSASTMNPDSIKRAGAQITATTVCIQAAQNMGYMDPKEITHMCGQAQIGGSPTSLLGAAENAMDCSGAKYPGTCAKLKQVNTDYAQTVKSILEANNGTIPEEQMTAMTGAYQIAVMNAVNADWSGVVANAQNSMKMLGWPGLGLWFQRLATVSDELDIYMSKGSNNQFSMGDIHQASDPGYAVFASTSHAFTKAGAAWKDDQFISSAIEYAKGVGNTGLDLVGAAGQGAISGSAMASSLFDGTPAFDRLQYMGYIAATFASAAKMGMDVAEGASSSTAGAVAGAVLNKTAAGAVLSSLSKQLVASAGKALTVVFWTCMALFVFFCVILPFLPMIYVGFMAIDWLLHVAVAAIAAPLFAAFHMLPGGSDLFHHKVTNGWQLIGFVVVFPTLVVIGFAVSMMIFNVSVPFILGLTFAIVPSGSAQSLLLAPATFILAGCFTAIAAYVCVNLMQQVPYWIAGFLGVSARKLFAGSDQLHQMGPGSALPTATSVLTK